MYLIFILKTLFHLDNPNLHPYLDIFKLELGSFVARFEIFKFKIYMNI